MHQAMLAALAALLLGGCFKWGTPRPGDMDGVSRAALSDAGADSAADARAADDAWAASAFALYGADAVQTCLTAFHQELADGATDMGLRGKPLSYRAYLADFLCDCARGQSAEACPEP
jgi:hypothetical protein